MKLPDSSLKITYKKLSLVREPNANAKMMVMLASIPNAFEWPMVKL
jgi:hypothetical protein